MPPDLEPASALASRILESADVVEAADLVRKRDAAVREPLERRMRELVKQCDLIAEGARLADERIIELCQERNRLKDHVAELEAQLASAREEALREVLRDLQQFADSFLAEARKAEISGRYDQFSEHARSRALVQSCAQRVRKMLPPPAAQKEPHGR